jgi:hypothetical protein
VQSASGVTAVVHDVVPLQALHGVGGRSDVGGAPAVLLELQTVEGGESSTITAFMVGTLPPGVDVVLGNDTLGPVMGGTTVVVGLDGEARVQFGTGQAPVAAGKGGGGRRRRRKPKMREGTRERKAQEKADHVARMAKIEATRKSTAKQVAEREAAALAAKEQAEVLKRNALIRHAAQEARAKHEASASAANKDTAAAAAVKSKVGRAFVKQHGSTDRTESAMVTVLCDVVSTSGALTTVGFEVLGGLRMEQHGAEFKMSAAQELMVHQAAGVAVQEAQRQGARAQPFDLTVGTAAQGGDPIVMMTVADLAVDGYEPDIDMQGGATSSAGVGRKMKYASALDKLVEMVEQIDIELPGQGKMPHEVRQQLIADLRALDPPLASREAPPRQGSQFIEHPDAVLRLRFKPDAQVDLIKSYWRPMKQEAQVALNEQVAEWRRIKVMVDPRPGETQCVSLPIVVPKVNSDGQQTGWRIAVDLRRLNKYLVPDRYAPEPRLDIVRRVAKQAVAVTTLDGASLFTQFRIAAEHQRFFIVQTGPGAFNKLTAAPFGVSQMPGLAQHFMATHVVAGDTDKDVFLDDLIMSTLLGMTWKQATAELLRVFTRGKRLNLCWNVDKIKLFQLLAVVLGYEIDCPRHSFRANPAKMLVIEHMQLPRTNKSMDRALNMAAAWSHSMPGLQLITSRLRALMHFGKPLVMTDDGRAAWSALIDLVRAPTSMRAYDPDLPVEVWTDACVTGLAWAVSQVDAEGRRWLVQAGGRKTQDFERRLSIPELETLALRLAFTDAPDLLVDTQEGVTWLTDAQAAALARDQQSEIQSRAVRKFVLEMQARSFGTFKIKQISGRANTITDALSRQWEDEAESAVVALMTLGGDFDEEVVAAVVEPHTPQLVDDESEASESEREEKMPQLEPAGQAEQAALAPTTSKVSDAMGVATTAEQLLAIEELLSSDEYTDRVDAEQRAFAQAQRADESPWMQAMREAQKGTWVQHRPSRGELVQADALGRLYRRSADGGLRLIVPDREMHRIMLAVHNNTSHKKVESMLASFEKHFFNPHARKVATEVIEACLSCQRVDPRRVDRSHGTDPTAWARFDMVQLDVFELRNAGPYQFALMTMDANTGVFEVTPMQQHTAVDVEQALRGGYLSRWPAPAWWQTDNAQELIGQAMTKLEQEFGIRRVPKAQRNPRGNGMVERQIGLYKDALRKITPIGADWTRFAAQAQFGLLCAVSKARGGFAPLELALGVAPAVVHGAEVQYEKEVTLAVQHPELSVKQRFAAQQAELKTKTAKWSADANASRLRRNQEVQQQQEAAGVKQKQFKIGDVVWLDDVPFKHAGKWDQKVRRSRALIVTKVDKLRRQLQVVDFETREPRRGSYPTHLFFKGDWWRGGAAEAATGARVRARAGQGALGAGGGR